MLDFINKMFSSSGEVSSKRVAAFLVLINLIILAYISTFTSTDNVTPEFMYDALSLIAGGGLGLTVIEKIFTKKEKKEESLPSAPEVGEQKEEIVS